MAKGSVNKVTILGRLGQDPETKVTAGGMTIATLSIATTELGKKDQATGQRGPDLTEWHRCKAFGKTAENAAMYLKKGSQAYIEGRLQTQKWQDQNGNDRWTTEIMINEMQFIGGKSDGQQQAQQQNQGYQSNNGQAPQQQAPAQQQRAPQQQNQNYQQPQQNYQQPQQNYQQQQNQGNQQPQQTQAAPQQPTGFDDFSDDIPF